jgi:hypothetical protein
MAESKDKDSEIETEKYLTLNETTHQLIKLII